MREGNVIVNMKQMCTTYHACSGRCSTAFVSLTMKLTPTSTVMLVSSFLSKEDLLLFIFTEVGVFCKIKQSPMKDLTCVSLSDSTILIVSTTDSRNVYAMSLWCKEN